MRRAGVVACLLAASAACTEQNGNLITADGDEIIAAARTAMADLQTVHVVGERSLDGERTERDVVITDIGECGGTVGAAGSTVKVVRRGGLTYVQPDEAFWPAVLGGANAPVVAVLGNRWIVLSEPEDQARFDRFCDIESVVGDILNPREGWTYTRGAGGVDDGVRTVDVVATLPDDSVTATFTVKSLEPHHVTQIEVTGDERATYDLFEFDDRGLFTAPPEDQTIDVEDLR